ncbi:MAG: hypothetical protein ACREN0_05585, partial [Thermodesulfobacteriota bacterium]
MGKYPPGLDVAVDYKFMDAVFERRSRRFGLGMEIEKGPLAYKSKHAPVPLSELEEAIIVWNGLGIKNINLSDFPPHVGLDLEMQFTSRTIPALGDVHRTELFYTNDEGTYMVQLRDKSPAAMQEFESLGDREKIVQAFRANTVQ